MVMLLLAVMLVSVYFMAEHADHDCSGEDCPICVCIHQCEGMLRSLGSGITGNRTLYILMIFVLVTVSIQRGSFEKNTPVSNKVRLND